MLLSGGIVKGVPTKNNYTKAIKKLIKYKIINWKLKINKILKW